jgi:hypothetical protein
MCKDRADKVILTVLVFSLLTLGACEGLVPHDTSSLLIPEFTRSGLSWRG